MLSKDTARFIHTHTHTHTRACAHSCPLYNCIFCVAAAIPPTIAEATNDAVDSNPMLTAGQLLTLTCSAMGTPRPLIDWYNGDSRITTSSRVQINKSEIGDSTLVSTLIISSVTVGDSGTYECRVENNAGSNSLQYSVVVSECVHRCVAVHMELSCLYCLFYMCGCASATVGIKGYPLSVCALFFSGVVDLHLLDSGYLPVHPVLCGPWM